MEHEKYNKKAVAVAVFMVLVIIVAAAALAFSKKYSKDRSMTGNRPVTPGQSSQFAPKEDTVTVQNKDDAKKALDDLDSLVNSAGDSSL